MEESPRLKLFYDGIKGWVLGKKDGELTLNNCGVDENKNRIKNLFNQVLEGYLEKNSAKILPIINAHGKIVDLFELFWTVRMIGGYDLVSRNNSWGDIAEECGFDFEDKTSVKLIYAKYLFDLDRCFQTELTESSLGNDEFKILEKLELLLNRLNQDVGVLLDFVEDQNDKQKNDNPRLLDCSSFISPNQTSDFVTAHAKNDAVNSSFSVGNKNSFDEKLNEHSKRTRESNIVSCAHKRKKQMSPWLETLDYISYVATHVDDLETGTLSEYLKKMKEHGNDPLWNRALLARKLILIKRDKTDVEISNNQKYKMLPSMYEDNNVPSRTSQRIPLVKCHSCKCHCSSSEHNQKPVSRKKTISGKNKTRKPLRVVMDKLEVEKPEKKYWEKPSVARVMIGGQFQAQVPKWTGARSASDPKWLGQEIWTPKGVNLEEVGKGRVLNCDCSFPDSTECIRFHIAEKRLKLKLEINSAFYKLRFDKMGEEVSLSWTVEEEKKFKKMIMFYSTDTNKFWRVAPKCFPFKTREKMVRYYFNVLVIRRRSYQNRVTPRDVDSDDDEKDFGSVGSGFGHKAMCFMDSSLDVCSLNRQRIDFDYEQSVPELVLEQEPELELELEPEHFRREGGDSKVDRIVG